MSEAAHEAAAANEDAKVSAHGEQFNPGATETKETCSAANRVCWKSSENPTEEHKNDAARYGKMAADHRAAAKTLRDAEASSCGGISPEDRDMSPFNHREDITEVKEHTVEVRGSKQTTVKKTTGADVVFRAVPGMTAEWLQRLVDCHVARAAAVGHEMPEMSYCPLMLKGVSAKVSSTGSGFDVDLSSEDPATAKEILRLSEALVAR